MFASITSLMHFPTVELDVAPAAGSVHNARLGLAAVVSFSGPSTTCARVGEGNEQT